MALDDRSREEMAALVRRDFLKGAGWLAGAVVLGSSGAILTACSSKQEEATPAAAAATSKGARPDGLSGNFYYKDDAGYEAARQAAIWVGNKPRRYPALIVFPKDSSEVAAAVKWAKAQKLTVGVRSGGHSWTAAGVQDGGMLIDLFTWNKIDIDPATRTAWVDPGTQAGAFNEALNKVGLAFPTAHASHVSLGGFMICGGFGRNSREWGIGCENVLEVECVNADGEVIKASATENPDFFWAVRGAGPAFFGIVTRFKVQAHDLPKVIHQRIDIYDMKDWEALMTWTMEFNDRIPAYVEPMVYRRRFDEKTGGLGPDTVSLIWVAMSDDADKVKSGLAMMDKCPVIKKRVSTIYRDDVTLQALYDRSGGSDPWGWRYATDGIWSEADPKKLVPAVRSLYDTPTPRTYIYYAMWGHTRKNLPDMAMSIQARSYIGAYVRWEKPEDDEAMFKWTTEHIKALEPLAVGSKMNDEARVRRTGKFFSDAAEKKLAELTAKHDPDGLFQSFLKPGDTIT